MSGLRVHYRPPGEFEECVLDVLAGVSFLRGVGAGAIAVVGHSFGGAVVIKAAELSPHVVAVAALSPQLHGTRASNISGSRCCSCMACATTYWSIGASEDVLRARSSRSGSCYLYADAGHGLAEASDALQGLLSEWLPSAVRDVPYAGRN